MANKKYKAANKPFKWKQAKGEIIIWLVSWYCRYALSYGDLQEIAQERGLKLERSTIYRWVQEYGPEISRRVKPYLKMSGDSYKVDETYRAPILRKLHEVLTGVRARLEYISVVIDGIIVSDPLTPYLRY